MHVDTHLPYLDESVKPQHSNVAIPLLLFPGQGADLEGEDGEEVQEEVRGEEVVLEDHPGAGYDSLRGREGGREGGREEGGREGGEGGRERKAGRKGV